MKIIAIVPARGGSKGIPKKNIKPLNNIPLIHYTLKFALDSGCFDQIIVSTDSPEIAEVASQVIPVTTLRPKELAKDHVADFPVVKHVVEHMTTTEPSDVLVYLRPTVPFRKYRTLHAILEKYKQGNFDSIRTVRPVSDHPYWMKIQENGNWQELIPNKNENIYYQRQLLPNVYKLSGSLDVFRAGNIIEYQRLYGPNLGYVIDDNEFHVDIDTTLDWLLAETIMKEGMWNANY